jgi:glucose/arabinose dehydrogenase
MMRLHRITLIVVGMMLGFALSVPSNSAAQEVTPEPVPASGGISVPLEANAVITETVPFSEAMLERLQLPDGFEVNVFASGLGNTRMMAFMPDGTLLITRRTEGDVIAHGC